MHGKNILCAIASKDLHANQVASMVVVHCAYAG